MKMFLDKIYKWKKLHGNMKEDIKKFFGNKFFVIISLFLLFGAISVFAGNIIVNENGIQSDDYYSGDGSQGITTNTFCTGADGQNYTFFIRDGLIVNVTQGIIEYNESSGGNSSFPSDDLISYYKLDEASGAVLDELSLNDGTNNGATRGATGKINNAYKFLLDSSTYAYSNSNFGITGSSSWTMNSWLNLTSMASGDYQTIYSLGTYGTANHVVGLNVGASTNNLLLNTWGGIGGGTEFASGVTLINNWHMFTTTYDGTNLRIYVDGNSVKNYTGTLDLVDNKFYFGGHVGGYTGGTGQALNGVLDEIGIWDRALNSTEVDTLYNGGEGLSYS